MNQLNHSSDNCTVVFNARVMHNLLNPNQFTMYANNCAGTSNKTDDTNDEVLSIKDKFVVYPNPSSGTFNVSSANKVKQTLLVEVLDMTGKKVFSQVCEFTGQDCQFNTNIVSGLYLIKITNTLNNETSLHKIVFGN